MKYAFFFLIFFCIALSCSSQPKIKYYTLTVNFAPSFNAPSRLIIYSGKDSGYCQMTILQDFRKKTSSSSGKHLIEVADLKSLTDFINIYRFKITGSVDSVVTYKKNAKGRRVKEVEMMLGNDGITVDGTLEQDHTERKFGFWSPRKGTSNAKLAAILLNIMRKSFPADQAFEYEFYTYIRKLKTYF